MAPEADANSVYLEGNGHQLRAILIPNAEDFIADIGPPAK